MYSTLQKTGVTIEQLYNQQKQIRVHLNHLYTLVLIGRDEEPDFLLSSFSGNYYVRSNKGMNRQKYTTLKGIEKAIKNLVNKSICFEGEIMFSISDEINMF